MQSLHATGSQSHINCTREPASRMQIVPTWPPVPCNLNKISHAGTICMRLAATGVQFACNWPPLGYNLHATGHSGTIYMQLANFSCNSGPLRAKPLVFCKHAARKNFWIKKWRRHKKIWESTLGYNLHVTGGHSITRQETSRQEVCKRPWRYFFSISKSTSSPMLPTIQMTALGYLVWKMCRYYEWQSHTEANFACARGQMRE